MNRLVKYCLSFAFILSALFSPGQQNKIDSLVTLTKNDKEDTTKVDHLNELARLYKNIGLYDTALFYSNTALPLAGKLNYKKGIAAANSGIGNVYDLLGDYPQALDFYFKALKLDEELNDKNGMVKRLGNIGIIYYQQSDYDKALSYYSKALKIADESGNKKGAAINFGNSGNVYAVMANKIAASNDSAAKDSLYQKAIACYYRALNINEELGNKNGIAAQLVNIGSIHNEKKEYSQALETTFKALKLYEELGDKKSMTINLGNIGLLYTATKKYAEAEEYLLKALNLAREIGAMNDVRQFEELITDLYIKTNRYELALEHYKKAMALKDTLFNEEKNKELTKKEMNYEFEKKEAAAKAEQDKKDTVTQIIIYSVSAGFGLVLVLAAFIFRGYRQKQKANVAISEQKKLVEEKQKDILDSIHYAKRIQQSLLPTEKYINKTLARLNKN